MFEPLKGWIWIPMTDRAPVEIEETAWPAIASSTYSSDLFEGCEASLFIRKHGDGRYLVYGAATGALGIRYSGELLLPGADLVEAIKRMGETLQLDPNGAIPALLSQLPAERI